MAKRSIAEWNSKLKEQEEFDDLYPEFNTVPLMLLKDIGTLNIVGKITGTLYVFHGGGSIVDVDKKDADIMLTKMSGNGCCPGSVGSTPYFKLAR